MKWLSAALRKISVHAGGYAASGIDWRNLRKQTNGMLRPEVYAAIYEAAKQAADGDFLDIGPAQGMTSIALTLGRRDSGRSGVVSSIDPFIKSGSLATKNDRAANIATITRNIREYGDPSRSRILPGTTSEVAHLITATSLAGMLIDADGAIDRDFALFFDRLVPNAPVIIDDYEDRINSRATDGYLLWDDARLAEYVASKDEVSLMNLCPLGKHFTTFRLANYFVECGFLSDVRVIRNTLFSRKHPDAPSAVSEQVHADTRRIRESILEEFHARRTGAGRLVPSRSATPDL